MEKEICKIVNLTRPDHGQREKINLNFYFHTSLWCHKGFMKALKAFIKPFEALHKSAEIAIEVNFYFNPTFSNAGAWKG